MEPRAEVLLAAFDSAHMMFDAVVAGMTATQASYVAPGSKLASAATIIAHAVFSEDAMVAEAAGSPRTLESGDFGTRTGIVVPPGAMLPAWDGEFQFDALLDYAAAVFQRTTDFLASVSASRLDEVVASPMGHGATVARFLAGAGAIHLAQHTGEISALKGVQGIRGLPF